MSFHIFHFAAVLLLGSSAACSALAIAPSIAPTPAPASNIKPAGEPKSAPAGTQTAVFAGGCFWGVEAVFEHVKGVTDARSGYSGGTAKTANYDEVSDGSTGHAEAVQITFNPAVISYEQLLKVFFAVVHDPTQLNRQGPDIGKQYRSAIFFTDEAQKLAAEKYIAGLQARKAFSKRIVTQIVPLEKFYDAEEHHQNYMAKNPDDPYIVYHDKPKVAALRKDFQDLYVFKP